MSEVYTGKTVESTKLKQYLDSAGRTEQCAPVSSVKGCPNKNWAEVEYFHVSGKPVQSTPFYLTKPGSTDPIAQGVLDANGYAYVGGLPDGLTVFDLYYTTDPKEFTIFEDKKPKPHGLKPLDPDEESTPIKALRYAAVGLQIYMTAREEVAQWVWESIQGDFNADRSMGQIAFDSVVSLIPVVDQVADVRDIAANLKLIVWDGKYKEFDPWFSLVTTLVGCIPEIGTAIKGSCRLVVKGAKEIGQKIAKSGIDVGVLIRFLNTIGEGNAVKWMSKHVDQFKKYAQDVLEQVYELFKKIKGKIENLKKTLLNKADEYFQRLLDNLEKAREAAKDIVFSIFAFCEKEIRELIEKIKNYFMKGKTRTKTSVQQRDLPAPKKTKAALTPEQAAARAAWIKTVAKEAGMDPKDVEKLLEYCEKTDSRIIVRFTNTDGLKFQKAGKDLLEKHSVGGFLPKPLDVKLKSAKPPHPHAGLVVEPPHKIGPDGKKIYSPDDQKNIDQLAKKNFKFDEQTGILKDEHGNAFYGDYDLQAVQRKATDQDGKEIHLEELTNPEDSDAIKHVNEGMRPGSNKLPEERNQIQHGAENDNHVKIGADGKPALDAEGHQIRATEQEILEGKSMLGRQHGDDERYVVIDSEEGLQMLDSPYDLYKFYSDPGDAFPWRYLSKAAMEAKEAAEKALAK